MKSKYDEIKEISASDFKRLTGVKRALFEKMRGILYEEHLHKKAKGGRKNGSIAKTDGPIKSVMMFYLFEHEIQMASL